MSRLIKKISNVWLLLCIAIFTTGCAPLGFLGGLGSLLGGLAIGGGIAASSGGGGSTGGGLGGGVLGGGGGAGFTELALNSIQGGGGGFPGGGNVNEIQTIVNPEPASMLLLGSGMAAMAFMRSRSKKAQTKI